MLSGEFMCRSGPCTVCTDGTFLTTAGDFTSQSNLDDVEATALTKLDRASEGNVSAD